MDYPELPNEALKDILILPIIFILIFIGGSSVFLLLNLNLQIVFASWCIASAMIVIALVVYFSFAKLRKQA